MKRCGRIITSVIFTFMFGLGLISNVLVELWSPGEGEIPRTATVVTGVDSSNLDGTYGVGSGINITVNFSESVFVTGTPQITLETGSIDRKGDWIDGNGTTILRFYYAIQAGDNTPDLDYNWTNALSLNGGTIKNGTGDDVDLTLNTPGSPGSISYTRNIVINTAGTLPAAPVLYTIFPDPDTDGDIILNWTWTGATEYHVYRHTSFINAINGSLTNVTSVTNTYVQVNGTPSGLWYLAVASYNASGESGPSNCDDVTITVNAPSIVYVDSNTLDGTYGVGLGINITVNFTEPVNVSGMPQLSLETGSIDRIADFCDGNMTSALRFYYTIQAGDTTPDLDYPSINALSLNGGTIKNGSGIDANLTLPTPGSMGSLSYSKNIVIDTTGTPPAAPILNGIGPDPDTDGELLLNWTAVPDATEYHIYRYNSLINVINGSLTNVTAGSPCFGNYTTLSGVPAGWWFFAVAAYNASGESGPSNCDNVTVTVSTPAVNYVDAGVPDGTYGVGQYINITVNFTETVYVTGTPQLTLETGLVDAVATYNFGDGFACLTFGYLVEAGHNSLDLDYVSANALSLNGGTIKNGGGTDANLTLPLPGLAGSLSYSRAIVMNTAGVPPAAPILSTILPDPDTDGDIMLNWTAVPGATEYHVYRFTAPITAINGSLINVTTVTLPNTTVYGVPDGLWYFAITAYNASGESGPSNCDDVTVNLVSNPPSAPILDIILPDPDTDGNVTLYWTAVSGATEYHVYCYDSFINTINGTLTNITTGSPDFLPNMTVFGLPSGLWYFVVSAFNASGESGPSNCQNVTVILDSFPQVNFTVNATYISAGMQVQFFNNTIDGNAPLSFLWNFGDGSANSTEVNPIHPYLMAGSYWPVLTVTDFDGDTNWTQLFVINVTGGLQNLPPGFDPVNDTMDFNVTEGFNQNIVLQTGYNVSISILLNTTSNVVVTIASWADNPTSSVPSFQNASTGIYFALEVNDTHLIVFPISITIPLPKDIPAGASVEEIIKSIQIFTWNTTTGWVGENFEISVNLEAGTMTIRATHLSIFAVGIKPVEDNSLWFWIGISLAIVGAAGAVLAIIKMRGRKKKKPQEEEVVLDFDWDDVEGT